MFGLGLHGWETVLTVSAILAAVAAIGVSLATYAVVTLTRAGNAANSAALELYKAEAGRITTETNNKAAAANERAEKARLETERLKKELSWRTISEAQLEIIRNRISKTPIEIAISWNSGDSEGANFAQQLAHAFQSSGIKIVGFNKIGMADKIGLLVSGSEKNEIYAVAEALRDADLGQVDVGLDKRKASGEKYFTSIFVGFRPPPALPSSRREGRFRGKD